MTAQNSLELQGNLAAHPFAEIAVEVSDASLSGSLRLSSEDRKTIVYFEEGELIFAVSNARRLKLIEFLRDIKPEFQSDEIEKCSNDLELLEHLKAEITFSETDIEQVLSMQLNATIMDVLSWGDGEWKFDPLARARSGIRAKADLRAILATYSRSLSTEGVVDRFRTLNESFALASDAGLAVDLDPTEAFIFSRLHGSPLSINDVISVSALERTVVLRSLYTLWLAGLVTRSNWCPAFSATKVKAIQSATLVLKKGAAPVTKPAKAAAPEPPPAADPAKDQPELSIEDYLMRVEKAESLYDVLGLPQDSTLAAIRKSYFNLAKQFHPDKFHREDPVQLRRVESAFSTLANAYETLKEPKSREIYDSKLKRERAERASRESADVNVAGGNHQHSERAAQEFEHGRGLLMDGDWEEALPLLARAVHFVPDNARYHAFYGKALSNDDAQRHKAVNAMQKAVSLDPQNAAFRMMLAEFLVKVNLIKRAEGELTRLLAMQPDHKEARSLLDSLSRK